MNPLLRAMRAAAAALALLSANWAKGSAQPAIGGNASSLHPDSIATNSRTANALRDRSDPRSSLPADSSAMRGASAQRGAGGTENAIYADARTKRSAGAARERGSAANALETGSNAEATSPGVGVAAEQRSRSSVQPATSATSSTSRAGVRAHGAGGSAAGSGRNTPEARPEQPQAKLAQSDAEWLDPDERGDAQADARALAGVDDVAPARLEAESGEETSEASLRDLDPDELARLLARYAHEPSAAQVVAAALRAQQHDPARFAELASRARLRGLLPHLDVGVRRGRGIDLRSTTTSDFSGGTTADDLTLFATLRFDLGQLLMANAEVTIAREERYARAAQNQLVRQVVRLYFIRRRLLLERDWRGRTDLSHELRIAEAEALLDTFTDGTFRRMMNASYGQPAQAPTLPSSGRR